MKFDWSGLTENTFADYCARMENGMAYEGDYVGCVRVGDLCFDLIVRDFNCPDSFHLDYDLYVGGIDDGYGYSKDGYPYTEDGGGSFYDNGGTLIDLTYDKFKEVAEAAFEDFINNDGSTIDGVSLIDKANEELHVW